MTNSKKIPTPVIFGEVLYDIFDENTFVLGGAPFNVAWNLHAMGNKPLLISRVGDDELGNSIVEKMTSWGMSTKGIQIDKNHPTGQVRVRVHQGQPKFEIVADQAYDYIDPSSVLQLLKDKQDILFYHGSLALRTEHNQGALTQILNSAKPELFVDVNLRAPWWKANKVSTIMQNAQWIKQNDDQITALAKELKLFSDDLTQTARNFIQKYSLEWIIVTQGEHGALIVTKSSDLHAASPQPKYLIDTVGAGDAFATGCIHGLMHDWPVKDIIEKAQSFASDVCGLRGATTENQDFYLKHLTNWNALNG